MNITPSAMTIAGSDSGGGAGIQADLKTFQAHGVFGTSAITCLTAQNPSGVTGILEVPPDLLEKQILAILDFFPIHAAKTGMLFSKTIIELVVHIIKKYKIKLVCDPVMVASSGAKLLRDDAIESIRNDLIPLSFLLTPNSDEAAIFLGSPIPSMDEMEDAAYTLYENFRVPILLKGGHLHKNDRLRDILYDGKEFTAFPSEYISSVSTHGTGCTYSAAITANLASGKDLKTAVLHAKMYLHNTIKKSLSIGNSTTLNHTVTKDAS